MKTTQVVEQFTIDDSLEEVFDIAPNTTIVEREKTVTELTPIETYDSKDNEIESQLQQIADAAMSAFNDQQDSVFQLDPKFKSRSQEVGVQFLNTALQAIKEKSVLKQHKDKMYISEKDAGKPKTVNNNLVTDRNTLMKLLKGEKIEQE